MTTAARRARKKYNHTYGEKSMARRAAKAEAALARMAQEAAELAEVDDFLGGPLPKPGTVEHDPETGMTVIYDEIALAEGGSE